MLRWIIFRDLIIRIDHVSFHRCQLFDLAIRSAPVPLNFDILDRARLDPLREFACLPGRRGRKLRIFEIAINF